MSTQDRDAEQRDMTDARALAEQIRRERDVWALAAMRAHRRQRELDELEATETARLRQIVDAPDAVPMKLAPAGLGRRRLADPVGQVGAEERTERGAG